MNKKKIFLLLLIILSLIVIIICFLFTNKKILVNENNVSVEVYFCNLGKSNVTLIKKDDYVILINTGLEEERDDLIDYFDRLGIDEIDYMILTNKSDKYVGNASFILNSLNVKYVYLNDYEYTSSIMEEIDQTLMDNYAIEIVLNSEEHIKLNDLNIDIYPFIEDSFEMEDKTLIVRVNNYNHNLYFLNDVSSSRFDEVDKSYLLVSENNDLYDIKSNYYVYTGIEKLAKRNNLLNEKFIKVFMNDRGVTFG